MTPERFDAIVSPTAERTEYQGDWDRQRETARAFLERFEEGYETQLLADEVGMGKTYVAMALVAAKLLRPTKNDRRALLITPASAVLRSKWEQELRGFSEHYLVGRNQRRTLRPLVVRNFWELVANLHDYGNEERLQKISKYMLDCILDSIWHWAVKAKYLSNKSSCFPGLDKFKAEDGFALQFASKYSMAAWSSFLHSHRAKQEHSVRALILNLKAIDDEQRNKLGWEEAKNLFKKFVTEQGLYEPNVLIIGMSSLKRPRTDQHDTQRFSTFVLGVLLKGCHEPTKKAFLKPLKKANLLVADADSELLANLAEGDLYRTRHLVTEVLSEDEGIAERWAQMRRVKPAASDVAIFFSDLISAVIKLKLHESGIELAVVDEAHNWKGGKNGAKEFDRVFKGEIKHKLLMSATPFQLAEHEMRRVFDYAIGASDKARECLEKLYDPADNLVGKCIASNDAFRKAWDAISDDIESVIPLRERLTDGAPAEVAHTLQRLSDDPATAPTLRLFCTSALAYRKSIDQLGIVQRQIVIRHRKPRDHRSFHSGADFGTFRRKEQSLYEVDGMTRDGDTFLNFLAMRLDQRIRIATGASKSANAHLMGGLTSSKAAFKSSSAAAGWSKALLDADTKRYAEMFGEQLDAHDHPKVLATVDQAFANYRDGRKTLIFCERVDTLDEIRALLSQRIAKFGGDADPDELQQARNALLDDHAFVDMRLTRMLCMRITKGDADAAQSMLDKVRPAAVNFAAECILKASAKVTERRVLRLLDLWAVPAVALEYSMPGPAIEMFIALQAMARAEADDDARWWYDSIFKSQGGVPDGKEVVEQQVAAIAEKVFRQTPNLWESNDAAALYADVWGLIDSEAVALVGNKRFDAKDKDCRQVCAGFYATLSAMQTGLRKVLLRPDLFKKYRADSPTFDIAQAVHAGVRANRGAGESPMKRLARFVANLVAASGSINPDDTTNTRRRSLWRGVDLRGGHVVDADGGDDAEKAPEAEAEGAVQLLEGKTKADRRVVMCAAFNSPLAPDVMVCTSIGSEGIDLHTECAEVIHHDLPWNPALLEQRIGRIDRVGRLTAPFVRIGIPFQEQNYERYQHSVLLSRAQRFEVLLGKPDFDSEVIDEEDLSDGEGIVIELDTCPVPTEETPLATLPAELVDWFSVDLALPIDRILNQRRASGGPRAAALP